MGRLALMIALSAAAFAGAAGASTVTLPEGCEGYVTIQRKGCTVSHLFTCARDPAGHQRRIDLGEDGLLYSGRIDAETQWVESLHVLAGRTERLAPDPADPASFSELLASGRDTFDFVTADDQGYATRFEGEDRLTGTQVEIDGVTLEETYFEVQASDAASGQTLWTVEGKEYVSRDWRTFIAGVSTYSTPPETYERDQRPMSFDFPGDDGFLSRRPIYDCGALMSKARR